MKLRVGCGFNIVPMCIRCGLAEDYAMADILADGLVIFGVGRGYHYIPGGEAGGPGQRKGWSVIEKLMAGAFAAPLLAVILSGCVSQQAYNEQAAQLEQARAQAATEQAEIAKMQSEHRWVMDGDLLFPEGGYQLSPAGEAALSHYLPQLRSLQSTKVVVYGFTDNVPVGPAMRRAGVANNIDLSSRRAARVVAYFRTQGVNPNILAAKGFGETHPIAPNDTPEGRAQNRRIEIVLEGQGA